MESQCYEPCSYKVQNVDYPGGRAAEQIFISWIKVNGRTYQQMASPKRSTNISIYHDG